MIPGADRTEVHELPRIRERISFLYLDKCTITRSDSSVVAKTATGSGSIPVASIGALILGPGTSITHLAMELLGDAGTSIIWAGENGVRYYASGRPLTHSSTLLMVQAKAVSTTRSRLAVARRMYQMRFPNEDVSHLTMQQLRGREGARVRSQYRKCSDEYGIPWKGREYRHSDHDVGDIVNKSLSSANACLYSIVHCVIFAMGLSPGLGFVHTGHELSFVYDIADLYKAELTIPIAFKIAKTGTSNVWGDTRKAMRDIVFTEHLMERIVYDVKAVLLGEDDTGDYESDLEINELQLWDEIGESVKSGVQYGKNPDDENNAGDGGPV